MAEGDFKAALQRLHETMTDFVNGNAGPIKQMHSRRADSTAFYGWGGHQHGYEAIAGRWEWALPSFHGGEVTYETLSTVVASDMAYAMEVETFSVVYGDEREERQWKNNVTHVFLRESDGWLLIHRHANQQPQQA